MRKEVKTIKDRPGVAEPGPDDTEGQELGVAPAEKQRVSVHIMLDAEHLEAVKKMADYAAEVGLIPNDPRGNVTDFINWCIMVGKETMRQYCLKRRKFI